MQHIASWLVLTFLCMAGIFLLIFVLYCIVENERKAIVRGIITLFALLLSSILILSLHPNVLLWLLLVSVLIIVLIFAKFGNTKIDFPLPEKRFDERDVMFSRNTLVEGTERFNSYYSQHPAKKAADDKFRKEPGLLHKEAKFYNEIIFQAADSTFASVNLLQPLVEKPTKVSKTKLSTQEISDFIKNWALKLGAINIGFTVLKTEHLYTHIGRGADYGKEVELDHKYAIAFTVEMNHKSLKNNPRGPVIMESSQQYLNAGVIAVQIAQLLRNLGFKARAHIDANYRLICPIVAQDAGLGTIGRMGLLMTPELGPRVRIGAVTTDLELPVNKKPIDYTVLHFCEICKKCATNCPSNSIPTASSHKLGKPLRWQINHERCFTYWTKIGTDCGRCISVCPYAHPDNYMHGIIRWMIKRNPINRWISLKLDDFFYGRKPN